MTTDPERRSHGAAMTTSTGAIPRPTPSVITLHAEIARLGGAIRTRELHALGWHRSAISRLLQRRHIIRARSGWYVRPGTAQHVIDAVRVGGQLTGARALAAHGIWTVPDPHLRVRVAKNACQLRMADDPRARRSEHPDARGTVHWSGKIAPGDGPRPVVAPLHEALDDYARLVERDHLLATVGDVLHQRLAAESELLTRYGISEWEGVDARCESGTETLFFVRVLRLGLHPWRQVTYPGFGRVDFQFGSRLAVEIDGATFHDTASQFAKDRAKDAALAQVGVRVARFSHEQVLGDWPLVASTMTALVADPSTLGSTAWGARQPT